jgi:acyl-CoA thioester hydrolase
MRGIFTRTFTVPATAIDLNGHVNNLEYLRWMQEIATEHSAAQGWPIARYLETRTTWVVRSHTITYLRPAFAGETLTMLTWIAGFREQMCPRGYLFWRGGDQQVLAKAETLWVFVDGATGRPACIPEDFKAAFDIIPQGMDVLQGLRLNQE